MSEHVYKTIELTGSSPKSSDDAVRNAIAKASKTKRCSPWRRRPRHRPAGTGRGTGPGRGPRRSGLARWANDGGRPSA